jgi:hypothetical protein
MNKKISLLSNLLLSSALLWGVPVLAGDELMIKETADFGDYCHIKFPPMRPDTLSWEQPVLDENAGAVIDYYGPCDYDPTGPGEAKIQRRMFRSGYSHDAD